MENLNKTVNMDKDLDRINKNELKGWVRLLQLPTVNCSTLKLTN